MVYINKEYITKMYVTKKQALKLGKLFNINFNVVDFDEWHYGLNVELEHGKKFGFITNLTNDHLDNTAKIAIAHLIEYPDYYKRLFKLEESANNFWSKKRKPNIFL